MWVAASPEWHTVNSDKLNTSTRHATRLMHNATLEFVSITEVSRDARSYVEVLERRSHSVLWAVFCVPRTSFSPMLGKVALFVGLYFLYKLVSTIFEWCRVHYILFTKLPTGPPAKNILLGNLLEATTKDFHRTHQEWADTYGGIYPYRALWIHVRSLRMACLVPCIPGIFCIAWHSLGLM